MALPTLLWMVFSYLFLGRLYSGVFCQCNPEFTDNCFAEVQKDLRRMVDAKNHVLLNGTSAAVADLCISLYDALSCCSDIIDWDCEKDPRRQNMDSWVYAFQMTYNHACVNHREDLQGILQFSSCWSIENFIDCISNEANLTKVETLFFTPLQEPKEISLLEASFKDCHEKARVSSCREQEDSNTILQRSLTIFLEEARTWNADNSAQGPLIPPLMLLTLCIVVFITK